MILIFWAKYGTAGLNSSRNGIKTATRVKRFVHSIKVWFENEEIAPQDQLLLKQVFLFQTYNAMLFKLTERKDHGEPWLNTNLK